MNVAFVHDHKFRSSGGVFYSPGGLPDDVLERYARIFGSATVIARASAHSGDTSAMSHVTHPDVRIVPIPSLLTGLKELLSTLKKADAIIARLPSKRGAIAVQFARLLGKPYMVELVGCPWDAYRNHSTLGRAVAPGAFLLTRWNVKHSPRVLYVTNEFLQKRYPTRGISIGCSDVSLQQLDAEVLLRRLEKIAQSESHTLEIGTLAAVDVKYKGQADVIRALSILNNSGADVQYHIAGAGDVGYLKSVADECNVTGRVHFHGALPRSAVFRFLDYIDVYIQPSRQEGLPRAVVEAMSRACPVVGSTVGGIPELVPPHLLFEPGDTGSIAEKLLSMTPVRMATEARRNFSVAQGYEFRLLSMRRDAFYRDFKLAVAANARPYLTNKR